MPVTIVPHDPAWPLEFLRIQRELEEILSNVQIVSIEHVGSTSIPGLVAKPVIDIDILVKPENLSAARHALVGAVPPYQDRGELGVPGRVAFRRPCRDLEGMHPGPDGVDVSMQLRRNIYVVLEGCLSLRNHLDLRRMLLEDSQLREEYGRVKKALVARGVDSVDEYCRGKTRVILKILRQAGWSDKDLDEVRKAND